MAKKRIFVSFDYDHDKGKKETLLGQVKLQESPFTFSDWSLKEAQKEKEWKQKADAQIKNCNAVFVIIGEHTKKAPGVKTEIDIAKKYNKPIYQLLTQKDYKNHQSKAFKKVGKKIEWTWENLEKLL